MAASNALFHTRSTVSGTIPWVTFTDPEVARVGLSEAQARERWGERVTVARFDYARSDRAITAGEAYGFAKLVADPRGRLVGATITAAGGGEAIAELTAWVSQGAKLAVVSRTVHAYPTLAEGAGTRRRRARRRPLREPADARDRAARVSVLRALEGPR